MTLVILAAGMGSRYGGLKQIDPIGNNGEFIIERMKLFKLNLSKKMSSTRKIIPIKNAVIDSFTLPPNINEKKNALKPAIKISINLL